jgi:DNA-binding GntR family transcriptional regulator
MSGRKGEPFLLAVAELRSRLRQGAYGPDMRLGPAEIGAELGLSPTPVREALSRLAGEGLLDDRRGEGFFPRRLSARDIADLYRLSLCHLRVAHESPARGGPPLPECGADPVLAGERLLQGWVAASGGRVLLQAFVRIQNQLAPIRRCEPLVLDGLAAELADLVAAAQSRDGPALALRRFHLRRTRAADRLAAALEEGAPAIAQI